MSATVQIRRDAGGVVVIDPAGGFDPASAPRLDSAVVEAAGGQLWWSAISDDILPAAVIDDAGAAQQWLWAIYGEQAALAVADGARSAVVEAVPANPELAASARRLGYAHWAARWWPTSGIDGIPALSDDLVQLDIATLTAEAEPLFDSGTIDLEVAPGLTVPQEWTVPQAQTQAQADYALAAGGDTATHLSGELELASGEVDWDWRRCPPGLVDASAYAVSWRLVRTSGNTVLRVSAAAAPGLSGLAGATSGATAYRALRLPHAGVLSAGREVVFGLELRGDTWAGEIEVADKPQAVEVFVPGIGDSAATDESRARRAIRTFAAIRLARLRFDPQAWALGAERAAASMADF